MVCIESISLNYSELTIRVGQKWFSGLKARLLPEDATCKKVKWSSMNENICTVTSRGYICPVAPGTTTVCAAATDGSKKKAYCEVTVIPWTYVEDVSCDDDNIYLTEQESYVLHATIDPVNASNQDVVWAATESHVRLTKDEENPLLCTVTGKTPGECVVTVTSVEDPELMGCCRVNVGKRVPLEKIEMVQKKVCLCSGASMSKTLQVRTYPQNATNVNLTWRSSNSNVVSVDKYGRITGKKSGKATITVAAAGGSIFSTCEVRVDEREQVIVEKDGTKYSRIVFNDGRIWNCINFDLINHYSLDRDDPFSQRFYDNAYSDKVTDTGTGSVYYRKPMKEYTDEEIKLIYTIDPHGLAAYVKEYAQELSGLSENLRYKDRIFRLLFGRDPEYYLRNPGGNWYEAAKKPSDLSKTMSESEFLFGHHPIYDCFTLREFITVMIDIFSMALACPAASGIAWAKAVTKVLSYYSLARSVAESTLKGDFKEAIGAIAVGTIDGDELEEGLVTQVEYRSENYNLDWATQLLSFSSNLRALADTFKSGPNYYKKVFNTCDTDLDFNILIKMKDGELLPIADIEGVIE